MSNRVNRETGTLEFERTLPGPPQAAFDAWTSPEQVTHWWDPTGEPLVSCAIDLRVGGSFRFETKGHAPPFEGTYTRIERPEHLEFQAMGAMGTVSFSAVSNTTRMLVKIRCGSSEHLEMFLKLGVNEGTARTLDNLVTFVSSLDR